MPKRPNVDKSGGFEALRLEIKGILTRLAWSLKKLKRKDLLSRCSWLLGIYPYVLSIPVTLHPFFTDYFELSLWHRGTGNISS
jgi:hypothetical protein